jgi:hypothetical protein
MVFAWLVYNSMVMMTFLTLAIKFDKWWIALFAIVFTFSLKKDYKDYRICDKCGKHSPYAASYNEALEKAKIAGWLHITDGNRDYCAECKDKI